VRWVGFNGGSQRADSGLFDGSLTGVEANLRGAEPLDSIALFDAATQFSCTRLVSITTWLAQTSAQGIFGPRTRPFGRPTPQST